PHDQLQEIFGGRVGQLPHAEVVDDQQRRRRELREIVLARAGERRFGEFLEHRMRLAVHDAVALQDRGAPNGLRQMALAGTRRPEEEYVLALGDEAGGRELVDERAVHLLVEIKVKGTERALGVTKAREFVAALEQAVLAPAGFP